MGSTVGFHQFGLIGCDIEFGSCSRFLGAGTSVLCPWFFENGGEIREFALVCREALVA